MSKDIWFAEFERLYNEKLDAGVRDGLAYMEAGEEADAATRERLADMIDHARLLKKEGRI